MDLPTIKESPPSQAQTPAQTQTRLVPIAPAAEVPPSALQGAAPDVPTMPYTCVTCARRKVKCDKTGPPCSTCRKARQECYYQEPAPRKRKRKPVDDLHDRLERYEQLLRENGILVNDEASPDCSTTGRNPTSTSDNLTSLKRTGTLLRGNGKTRYIDSNIWRTLGDDLHPSSDEEDGEYEDHATGPTISSEPPGLDPASAAFFGPSTPGQIRLIDLHPTYDVAMKLWKMYSQNVDPVIKVCHGPTTLETIQRAATNPSAMSKVTECLVFSIYHFAVASTTPKECEQTFSSPKTTLLKRYHNAARQALVSCHFLRTTELAVLQAYMLFLLSVRNDYDPHTFWILTGIAVRIAQRMGLHRDGETLGLNPFDVQMRRRVFWQLLPLDGLSGQISGTGIAISADSWDTKQPLNINDDDIWPGMETAPVERKGATDMIFCLARSEVGRFHQKVKPSLGNWSRLWESNEGAELTEALAELENIMEEKYIRYCDISNPVHCLTMGMARGSLCVARLRIRLPKAMANEATLSERHEVYNLAMKVLDHSIATHMNGALNRYNWHLKAFFQWDPLIWLLRESQRDDSVADPEVIWNKVGQIFTAHPDMIISKRSIDIAMARLALRSWDARNTKDGVTRPDPGYINELRAAFGRREAQRHLSSSTDTTPKPGVLNPFDPQIDITGPEIYTNGVLVGSGYLQGAAGGATAWGYGNWNMMDDPMSMVAGNAKNGVGQVQDLDYYFWDRLMQDPQNFAVP